MNTPTAPSRTPNNRSTPRLATTVIATFENSHRNYRRAVARLSPSNFGGEPPSIRIGDRKAPPHGEVNAYLGDFPRTSKRPGVSVVIPALNDERDLPHIAARMPHDVDEIVVNDKSVDRTAEVARELWPPGIQISTKAERAKETRWHAP